ncbi:major facilitator superfamily protein [Hypoxylon crocopeplum]|nr:major facilitator superfamily protein [Hypoxylon crocopeplum]
METPENSTENQAIKMEDSQTAPKSLRFWLILVALSFAGLLTSLEATITSTALPTIVASLGGEANYIWAVNGYYLATTALQPLFGQLANIFGRRWPIIAATATFTLGSGICGGAVNMAMLIAGRVIQGIGAAGINVLIDTIMCDLVPLRERGKYLGILIGMTSVGTALGPLFGGLIVAYSSWRWVFYMALPIGGAALVMLTLFLQVKYNKSNSLATNLTRIDWLGNVIFVSAVSSALIALGWAGTLYPWSSFRVIVPLILGMVGILGFVAFEASPLAPNPMMPPRLFSNRTSATAFSLTFLQSIVGMWALYFLPIYFQGSLIATASRAGIMLLPTILVVIPSAIIGGLCLSKFGQYKPIQFAAFALITIGFGLFTLLDENSSTGAWVGFQIIESVGIGLIIPTLLPALLAPLTDDDTALATGAWSFIRSFGMTWGTAVPAAILDNRASQLASSGVIADAAVAAEFMGGGAYQHATAEYLNTLPPVTRSQVQRLLSDSLRRTWLVAIAFAALGFVVVGIIREVPLRKELGGEFGIAEKLSKPEDGDGSAVQADSC